MDKNFLKYKLIPDNYLDSSGKIKEEFKYKINIPELKIKDSKFIPNPEDKFKTMLFLPPNSNRIAEGGLRTRGLFKFSYKKVKRDFGENKNNASENDGIWYICDLDGNPAIPAPDKLQEKINQYTSNLSPTTFLPLITVITVVYNGAKYLEDTIKSVINQTYPNVEYIIIDGGSTDGTIDIIKKYEDYIDYWVSEPDKGIYDAMNKGWSLANDDSRILFLGAGDMVKSFPLTKELAVYSDYVIYGKVELANSVFKSKYGWRLKLGNTLHHQGLLVPKKIHRVPPFNIKYPIYADYDFNLRLYKLKVRFIYSDYFIAYAMPGGVSKQLKVLEMSSISFRNFGIFWGILSFSYCSYQYLKIKLRSIFNIR